MRIVSSKADVKVSESNESELRANEPKPEEQNPFDGLHEIYMAELGTKVDAEVARADAELSFVIQSAVGASVGILVIPGSTSPNPGAAKYKASKRRSPRLESDMNAVSVFLILTLAVCLAVVFVYCLM